MSMLANYYKVPLFLQAYLLTLRKLLFLTLALCEFNLQDQHGQNRLHENDTLNLKLIHFIIQIKYYKSKCISCIMLFKILNNIIFHTRRGPLLLSLPVLFHFWRLGAMPSIVHPTTFNIEHKEGKQSLVTKSPTMSSHCRNLIRKTFMEVH